MNNFYIDCEFHEGFYKPFFGKKRHFIDLISIALVRQDGKKYYAISNDFDIKAAWYSYDEVISGIDMEYPEASGPDLPIYWLRENVLKPIFKELYWDSPMNIQPEFNLSNFKYMIRTMGKSNVQIIKEIQYFLADLPYTAPMERVLERIKNYPPKIYAYFADYDWVLFCSLFGKMINLPEGMPMYCIDLKQMLDQSVIDRRESSKETFEEALTVWKNKIGYPIESDIHHALHDATWNKQLHNFLKEKSQFANL